MAQGVVGFAQICGERSRSAIGQIFACARLSLFALSSRFHRLLGIEQAGEYLPLSHEGLGGDLALEKFACGFAHVAGNFAHVAEHFALLPRQFAAQGIERVPDGALLRREFLPRGLAALSRLPK